MKKFLSLVLALVMTMSLVTISAGADFADDADINYDEAVAVMAAAGIVGGSGGSFYPASTLSRGAAAKILAILVLGADGAAKLDANVAPFSDVPAGSTFAPYISWAASKGYIGGYADGTYRPGNSLTGYAFLKMLLCAMGYDAAIEGYTGANYGAAVAEDAMEKDLLDGIDGFVGSVACTREEACQMALNVLQATRVKYDNKGTNISTSDGTTINVGASAAEDVTGSKAVFMEMYQPDLKKDVISDDFGRPANKWTYDKKSVGTFAWEADYEFVGKMTQKDLYNALNLPSSPFAYYTYTNGNAGVAGSLNKADTTSAGKVGLAGTVSEVYLYENVAGDVIGMDLVQIQEKLAKVTGVKKNDDGERVIVVAGKTFVTEDFAVKDWVLYTEDETGAADEAIKSVVAAEKLTGKVSKVTGGDKFTIDGTTYESAANRAGTATAGKNNDYYLNSLGYVVKIEKSSDEAVSVDNLAIVEEAENARGNYAVLRFADGSKKTVDTDKNYNSLENYIVKFDIDDGEYELKPVTYGTTTAMTTAAFSFNSDVPTFNGVTVNNATNFLMKVTNGDDTEWNTYVGYKNVPDLASASMKWGYVKDDDNDKVIFVYVEADSSKVSNANKNLTVIAYNADAKTVVESDTVSYYEYDAYIDGELTSVKVDPTLKLDLYNYSILSSYSENSKGVITSVTKDSNSIGSGEACETIKVSDGVITFDVGGNKGYTDDVVVLFVNDDAELYVGDIDSILEDDNNAGNGTDPYDYIHYVVNSDGVVTGIVLFEN